MNEEFINLKDQEILYTIQEYLKGISIASTLLEKSADMAHNILVAVSADQTSINIMYVPLPEDHFTDIRLLQLFSLLVAAVKEERKKELSTLLNELNSRSPIGSFSINERRELGFKYIFPVSRFGIPGKGAFLDIFSLYADCLEGFAKLVTDMNAGLISLQAALDELTASES